MTLTVARRLRGSAARFPQLLDAALGAAIAGPVILAAVTGAPAHPHPSAATTSDIVAIMLAVLAVLAVTGRRLWPLPIFLATGCLAIGYTVTTRSQAPVILVALVLLTYTLAARTDRRTAWLAAGLLVLTLGTTSIVLTANNGWAPGNIGMLASLGMATAIGDATRTRRAYVAQVEERARNAEQTREDEIRRRVVEERMRIARELHDVVSHHIAVINVQAGAAGHVLARQPEAARDALEHIRRSSDTVLRELSAVVAVLRQVDDLDLATDPVRGLSRLPELLSTVRTAGLVVEYQQTGEPRELPAVVDLAAYRIVQEALTNAHKHGTGQVHLHIGYLPQNVTVEVTNPTATPGAGAGYGIVGMRERAASTGGTLITRTTADQRFHLRATLPALADRGRQ